MKIAIAQINTRAGDFDATVGRMVELSSQAADCGVELLVFPLATLTGIVPMSYESHEGWMFDIAHALERLSYEVHCPCFVPYVCTTGDNAYPHAAVVEPGHIIPMAELALANDSSRGQNGGQTIAWGNLHLGVAYTYEDIDAFVDSSSAMDALLFVSGYAYALDDASSALGAALLDNRFRMDATALDAWVVGVGSFGGYGWQVFSGASFVLTPQGELAASAPAFEESLLCACICKHDDKMPSEPIEPELYNRSLHLWEVLVLGLHDYLDKLGVTSVALVLDGTLSSCLLASLATDALGPTHVHALLDESKELLAEARSLADALHVKLVDASSWMETTALAPTTRSFVRQACLAAYAQEHDALPLSGEDKTFLALEVGAVPCLMAALLPFGDVYRSDLIELAHMRNTISPVIPRACLRAYGVPRIEGLSNVEQVPETQLRRVDVTLATHIEWERTFTDVVARQGADHTTEQILRHLFACEPGRMNCPPCITASSRTVFDLRRPSGLAWCDRVRSDEERAEGSEKVKHLIGDDHSLLPVPGTEEAQLEDGLAGLLNGLDAELVAGTLPDGVDKKTIERSIDDLMGLIQDIMQGEGFSAGGNGFDGGGPFDPLTWGSPFSEN